MNNIAGSNEPLIGICTVLYSSDDVLAGFFKSLSKQVDINFRLYIFDNSPTDSGCVLSHQLALQYQIDAVIVFNNANLGVAKGNNQGIEQALADGCAQILLANNDTEFSETSILTLSRALEKPGVRVAAPKIMYFDKPTTLWYAGGHINGWTIRCPHYGMNDFDSGQFNEECDVGYSPTCFLMLKASIFNEVGLMDEKYFVYYDDTDYVWRMALQGIGIRYIPESIILHKVSSSTGGGNSPFTLYYINRNRLYFIRKNLSYFQKMFALVFVLSTRLPKLLFIPFHLSKNGWRGVLDGLKMKVG